MALSLVAGVMALMAVSFELKAESDPLTARGVRLLGAGQNLTFMIAAVLMVWIVSAS